ncbi:MAG: peptidylprolyl isomerase [Fibrobacterota bacterium]
MKGRIITVVLAAIFIIAFSGCSESGNVAAKSKYGSITYKEVEEKVSEVISNIKASNPSMPEPDEAQRKAMHDDILKQMGTNMVLRGKAEEEGLSISDSLVDIEYTKYMNMYRDKLKESGLDTTGIFEDFREKMLLDSLIKKNINPDDEVLKAWYKEHDQDFSKVKASHILVKTEGDSGVKEAEEKAQMILDKLEKGGGFESLAKQYSDCPSSKKGGDLGFFDRGRMVKPFSDAAFKLEKGEHSGIVKTRFGYHIIKCTERESNDFEKVRKDVLMKYMNEKAPEYIEKVKEEAGLEFTSS